MSWRFMVAHLAKVPRAPSPPPGDSNRRVFRAGKNFLRFKQVMWGARQLAFLLMLAMVTVVLQLVAYRSGGLPPLATRLLGVALLLGWMTFVIQLPISWAVMRLDYELRWYQVTNRSLRIREGILRVREKTMSLANIQNIAIQQGPLQRMLGIADVEVRNAGGGSGGPHGAEARAGQFEPLHVAYFRGVDCAELIRDVLREAVRKQRDSGLGDPDDDGPEPEGEAAPVTAVGISDPLSQATRVLEEARALRAVLAQRRAG
jgi:membrane protein YdbS with pleckstrin-like domain